MNYFDQRLAFEIYVNDNVSDNEFIDSIVVNSYDFLIFLFFHLSNILLRFLKFSTNC